MIRIGLEMIGDDGLQPEIQISIELMGEKFVLPLQVELNEESDTAIKTIGYLMPVLRMFLYANGVKRDGKHYLQGKRQEEE